MTKIASQINLTFSSLIKLAHDDVLRSCRSRVAREVEGRRRKLVLVQLPVEQILDVDGLSGSGCSDEKKWFSVLHKQVHEVVVLGCVNRRNDLNIILNFLRCANIFCLVIYLFFLQWSARFESTTF